MEAKSDNPLRLGYFYPHSTKCPERKLRAENFGVELKTYRQLYQQKKAQFEGHKYPNFVLPSGKNDWDDADRETIKEHLNLAQATDTGFIWDLYVGCTDGRPIIELDEPFRIMLEENHNVPFSVMFSYNRSRVVTPVPERYKEENRCFDLNKSSARWMVDYLGLGAVDHPMMVTIEGRPVITFAAFSLSFDNYDQQINELIKEFKSYALESWGVEPYVVAVICDYQGAKNASDSGLFDAVTGYCYLPSFSLDANPIQDYQDRIDQTFDEWEQFKDLDIPFFAPFSFGWDASIRAKYASPLDKLSGIYPHAPIITGVDLDKIEAFAKKIYELNIQNKSPIIPVFSFNEAEEGASLLPIENQDGSINFEHTKAMINGFNQAKFGKYLLEELAC